MDGTDLQLKVMCRMNKAPKFPDKADKDLFAIQMKEVQEIIENYVPEYVNVWNNTKIDECALKCTQQANDRKVAGCCEYRANTRNCAWSPDGSYLAPEVRSLEGEPRDNLNTKSVLCTKGNIFDIRMNNFYFYINVK